MTEHAERLYAACSLPQLEVTYTLCFMPFYTGNSVDVQEGEEGTNRLSWDCQRA